MNKKISLTKYCETYCVTFQENTRRGWLTFKGVLTAFNKKHRKALDNSFCLKDYQLMRQWLMAEGYANNTIVNISDKIKAILRAIAREGYPISKDLHLMEHMSDESQAIFLTTAEIKRIIGLELNKSLSNIRDRFVIGCLTGLRFSDYSRINSSNIVGDNMIVLNKKTNIKVIIPVHPAIRKIFKKHKNNLPAAPSYQYFNKKLPTIACKARINDRIIIERKIGNDIRIDAYLKHELVRSHTARRSAATNMYLAGIPIYRIMLITGHQSEQAFLKYIRIRREENAATLSKHPFFS